MLNRFLVVVFVLFTAPATAQEPWMLEAAARRAFEVAPEARAADADVAARTGELEQAGAWPNPSIELRADDKLGIEDGKGGTDLTQTTIRQPLPLSRLTRQRRQAEASLKAAQAARRYQRLSLETQAARAFHALQLAVAKRTLARDRLRSAEGFQNGRQGDRLVRYLSPLDRLRLDVLRETARQTLMAAEKEHEAAASVFRALLALAPDSGLEPVPLTPVAPPPPLAELQQGMETHPAILAAQQELEAARAGMDVARAQRFADPTLNFFRERDFLGGVRRNVSGVGIEVQIPLWNLNRGPVVKAQAEADKAGAQMQAIERDISAKLLQSREQLARLIEQAGAFRANVLEPSRKVFELTRKSFATGEVGLLALLDANSTYFDAEERHTALLAEQWQIAADLRLAAGRSLSDAGAAP